MKKSSDSSGFFASFSCCARMRCDEMRGAELSVRLRWYVFIFGFSKKKKIATGKEGDASGSGNAHPAQQIPSLSPLLSASPLTAQLNPVPGVRTRPSTNNNLSPDPPQFSSFNPVPTNPFSLHHNATLGTPSFHGTELTNCPTNKSPITNPQYFLFQSFAQTN